MMRSGAAFNPMRRTPPPPPYIDTFELNPKDYIGMTSAEGHRFVVHQNCACVSPLIRKCFADHLALVLPQVSIDWGETDTSTPTIHFPTLSTVRLEVIVQYLYYKHRYEGEMEERPPFNVPLEAALEVMKVAEALQC
ncbi:transcription elongation factor B, polypeptide 1 [Trypanosoma rangeli]|uniref:Elongin-C n=1 Tax=Trypanosoma rangeli TaxID=5698 RepID=A0A3R7REP2_TRYRA|nr:transcription elongation factor B, polypeptide 1 [Trypanosoma rangeli]RNF01167.1 transcription elongation factor B, polypeptide 1 [Trypanosoma rangeli]|eukprot:RNF01167.1 transcription elongation factor B, polypeptide 1 [Trypanosoma rangeli]